MNHYHIIANIVIGVIMCITNKNNNKLYNTTINSDVALAMIFSTLLIYSTLNNNTIYMRTLSVTLFVIFCLWLYTYSINREISESIYTSMTRPLKTNQSTELDQINSNLSKLSIKKSP